MGGQTMKIAWLMPDTRIKDFKPQSRAEDAPSSHSRGAFPNHVDKVMLALAPLNQLIFFPLLSADFASV